MSKKSGVRKLLIVGIIGGLVALLVAAWKASKPVEDPWENEPSAAELHDPVDSREASVDEVREILTEDQED